jgi:hypothetical protein
VVRRSATGAGHRPGVEGTVVADPQHDLRADPGKSDRRLDRVVTALHESCSADNPTSHE